MSTPYPKERIGRPARMINVGADVSHSDFG